MPDNAFISIRNIDKYFGRLKAIDNLSIDIAQGEFFSLLGASGCGKTTLLRMLAGFEAPSGGEIHIDGQPMSEEPPHHRPVNTVFQNYAIFPHLNVRDNIAYGLRRHRLSKVKRHEMVEELLELIKLPGFGDRKANELSGGQRQRIALARALILKPKVLLLDEPLGALDKQLREEMQLELRALQRTVGITFVFVTHDQEEALTLSDRIAVMAEGRVLQLDTPSGLYERPRSREVASFIGTMNFFDGTVAAVNGTSVEVEAQGLGRIRAERGEHAVTEGERIEVAIRPEKLELSEARPGGDIPAIRGTLENSAYLGERSHFFIRLDGLDKPVAVSSQNRMNAIAAADQARPIWLSWPPEAVVLLAANR